MSLTSFFTIVCFEIDVLVCIFISCSVFKDHLHLSSAHLYYQILFTSSNVFLTFFHILYCMRLQQESKKNRAFQLYLKCS